MRMSKTYFQEEQRPGKYVWIIFVFINIIFLIGVIKQIGLGRQFGNQPMNDAGLLIVTILFFLLTVVLGIFTKLQTYIDIGGIYIRYLPFQIKYKFIDWKSVERVNIRRYNPFTEYGGYGIKKSFKGTSYTTKGRVGLELQLSNGKKILIGTLQPEYLTSILLILGKIK